MSTPSTLPSHSPTYVWRTIAMAMIIVGLLVLMLISHYQPPAASMFRQQSTITPTTSASYLWLTLRNANSVPVERAPRTRPRKVAQRVAT